MLGVAGSLIGDIWGRNPENLHMELAFLSAIDNTDLTSPGAVIGARAVDTSVLPDGTRRMYFVATLRSSAPGLVAVVELWNVTRGYLVTDGDLVNSGAVDRTVAETFVSAPLTEGTGVGHIRTDSIDEYEVRLYRVGGAPADEALCLNVYLRVIFD